MDSYDFILVRGQCEAELVVRGSIVALGSTAEWQLLVASWPALDCL